MTIVEFDGRIAAVAHGANSTTVSTKTFSPFIASCLRALRAFVFIVVGN